MRLCRKVESSAYGYTQKHQQSDRKPSTASKVQKIRSQLLKEVNDVLKKPSMQRTQKSIINSSYLIDASHIDGVKNSQLTGHKHAQMDENYFQKNYSYIPKSGKNPRSGGEEKSDRMLDAYMLGQKSYERDGLRPRLVKKNRILSSGLMMKPSWG